MKKLVFVLLLVSAPAWTEWTLVRGDEQFEFYSDPSTIRKKGNMVKMWSLNDYKVAQRTEEGKVYLSARHHGDYDCEGKRFRVLNFSYHSGQMAGGSVVSFASG